MHFLYKIQTPLRMRTNLFLSSNYSLVETYIIDGSNDKNETYLKRASVYYLDALK